MNTRDQLVQLGEKAMRRNGYGGFSYADLAREAGIRKASIHHHFPAKADLGLAVLDQYADRLASALDDIKAKSRTGAQAMQACISLYRSSLDYGLDYGPDEDLDGGKSMCLCSALAADEAILTPAMHDMLIKANRMVAQWLESVLLMGRQDRSIVVPGLPANDAIAILAQLQGAQLIARAARDGSMFDTAMSSLIARMSRI